MELIKSGEYSKESERLIFEKGNGFKYLGATLIAYNDQANEKNIRLNKAEKTFYELA